MTFWLVSSGTKSLQELTACEYVAMPDFNIDDFSSVLSLDAVKAILMAHDPDLPPESLALQSECIARFVLHMREGDMLCFVFMHGKKIQHLNFAEVTGHAYAVEVSNHIFENRLPIRWFEQAAKGVGLHSYQMDLQKAQAWPVEIQDAKMVQSLRSYLPLPGSRFEKWKWLAGLLLLLQVFMMLKGTIEELLK